MASASTCHFVTLGMFIIDEFDYLDEHGNKSGKVLEPQIGGGGTYAALGARIWLPPNRIGMIVDRGGDFPPEIQASLAAFGEDMWLFRDDPQRVTTRAVNIYRGDNRGAANLHFICSPSRARSIISEALAVPSWKPVTIYEPIPDRCVPEELPALREIMPHVDILSPNSDEALSLLSMPQPPSKASIEEACMRFLELGVGPDGKGHVIIRSGSLGAYVASRARSGRWIDAFWTDAHSEKVVDVTGAGNSFLGGLSAGLSLAEGDVFEVLTSNFMRTAVFYAAVSASFTIEQLTQMKERKSGTGDDPYRRLKDLKARHAAP
ncbi:Ribokinase-like protein [Phellopilus nigrolimitatus]|nr:Ribokinase-like protein [Phellopilus nigrolimitatus]